MLMIADQLWVGPAEAELSLDEFQIGIDMDVMGLRLGVRVEPGPPLAVEALTARGLNKIAVDEMVASRLEAVETKSRVFEAIRDAKLQLQVAHGIDVRELLVSDLLTQWVDICKTASTGSLKQAGPALIAKHDLVRFLIVSQDGAQIDLSHEVVDNLRLRLCGMTRMSPNIATENYELQRARPALIAGQE